jgi:hypothetical protein
MDASLSYRTFKETVMKQEMCDAIYQAAPKLYRNEPDPFDIDRLSPRQLARYYGPVYFGVGKGWFQLLMDLSIKLEAMEGIADIRVVQVKEKYGGLRFYLSSGTDEMFAAINKAEDLSYETCEECGEPGKIREGGWVSVLCDEHAKEK